RTGSVALCFVGARPLGAQMTQIISPESPFKEEVAELLASSGVTAGSAELLGPFTDLTHQIAETLWDALLPGSPGASLSWELLTLTLIITLVFFVVRKGRGAKGADGYERPAGFWQYLFPRDIYGHRSARTDLWLYLLDRGMMPVWFVLFLGGVAPAVEQSTISTLTYVFGSSPALQPDLAWRLIYGLVTLLIADMIFYWTHYMMHKTSIGWAIHKVHHSAEVLTPLTRPREHFIAGPIWALGPAIGLSVAAGLFTWVFAGNITQITVWNVGIFAMLYALNGNFRHHHVSFRYPRWLELWLQSPGMHHTHHSYLEKHWDTNLGLVTSIWDRLMGTLYIPAENEATPWGLTPDQQPHYATLRGNLLMPFKEISTILRARRSQQKSQRPNTRSRS
ncbi:MAG: sterol desaturase family protein, partial [Pseudomonadota bacterium]